MAADVNPSQDDGRYQEHSQHDAHNGAQVHRRALGLWGQVVLKSCGDDKEKLGLRALGSDRVPRTPTLSNPQRGTVRVGGMYIPTRTS